MLALRSVPDFDVFGEAGNAEEALALAKKTELDLVVVDILMPIVSGISLAGQMLTVRPSCKILALSVIDEPVLIADMLRAGAGVMSQDPTDHQIVEAIHAVLGGIRYLPLVCLAGRD